MKTASPAEHFLHTHTTLYLYFSWENSFRSPEHSSTIQELQKNLLVTEMLQYNLGATWELRLFAPVYWADKM